MPAFPLLMIALLCLTRPAFAAEGAQHRAASPHTHGTAEIRLVRDGALLRVEIDMPMADALGHEQRASSPEQRAALLNFQRSLMPHQGVLGTAPACKQQSGEASAEGGEGEHRDVHLVYQLACPTGPLTADFAPLFKKFERLQQAQLQWLDGPQAGAGTLTPAEARAELPGQ